MSPAEPPNYFVPMVAKALDVLEAFSSHREELTLEEIIARTGVAHASAFRIVHTLVRRGYLTRIESGKRYRLSWRRPKLRVGYAGLSNEVPFSVAVAESLQQAAEENGLELLLCDNRGDSQIAIQNARDLIARGVDFAIEFQRHEKVAAVLANLFAEARVKTIAIHIPQPGAVYFGVDNYKAGRTAGEALGQYARKYWSARYDAVVLLDVPQAGHALHSRMLGVQHSIEQMLGAIPESRLHWLDGAGRLDISRRAMVNFIRRNAKAKRLLVSAVSDHSALGAVAALEASGLAATSVVVGHDGDQEALQELAKPGSPYLGTVAFFPRRYGKELIELMLRIHRGDAVSPAHYIEHELIVRQTRR
ncbi:MAG TPA: substrate-binding domain-containing protein [Bryobacteraceae bacterium]